MDLFSYFFTRATSGGGGGSPTLITKQITENGTYVAESDNADGYSQVTVNVDLKAFVNNIVNAELNER